MIMSERKRVLLSGAFSGVCSRVATEPLDVLKIRLQLQLEAITRGSNSKYTGIIQTVQKIVAEEGLAALWKGLVPGIMMYPIYNAVQFSCVNEVRKLSNNYGLENSAGTNFIAGCIGSTTATTVVYPLDVLRTRLVGQGEPKHYRNVKEAVTLMYKEKGIRTFYRGMLPAIMMYAPQNGMNFAFYTLSMSMWISLSPMQKKQPGILHGNTTSAPFICGAFAGMASKTIALPLDMLKKRLQVVGFEEARKPFGRLGRYSGLINATKKIFIEEGFLGFYKGTLPSILKAGVSTSVAFYTFEYALAVLRSRENQD